MAQENDIVIAAATRTAVGSFNGAFANVPAHELGAAVVKAVLEQGKTEPDAVDELIFGQVLTAAQGQNPARQASMLAGKLAGEIRGSRDQNSSGRGNFHSWPTSIIRQSGQIQNLTQSAMAARLTNEMKVSVSRSYLVATRLCRLIRQKKFSTTRRCLPTSEM